jgi:ribosome recycling factor
MAAEELLKDAQTKMEQTVSILQEKLKGIRIDRASPTLLDSLILEYNGGKQTMSHFASIILSDAKTLKVQPIDTSDKKLIKAISKAISNANLGVNPTEEENGVIKVMLPSVSEQRRKELIKLAHKYAEDTRIAVRNVRRHAMDKMKSSLKSEEEKKRSTNSLQTITDKVMKEIDSVLKKKEEALC